MLTVTVTTEYTLNYLRPLKLPTVLNPSTIYSF